MGKRPAYPVELREQAVRLVYDWRRARGVTTGGFAEVAEKLGVHRESVRNWVTRAEIDSGQRPGVTTQEHERITALERENFELRRANGILKSTAIFFGAELDRRPKR